MKPRHGWVVVGAAIAALVIGCSARAPLPAGGQAPAAFAFALIGDLGYFPDEEPWLTNLFEDLNRSASLAFVVHVGDLASRRYACTDELLDRRLGQFRALAHPLVYTPGDNDWTDCHSPGDPMDRLAKIRARFFAGDHSLGRRTVALTRQSQHSEFAPYRENARWDLGGVTFLTLHVPGSNNGRGRSADGDAEYAQRNRANLAWLQQGFAHARTGDRRAVVVLQQANVFPEFTPQADAPKTPNGYTDIRARLEQESAAFGRPVILVHGDSHYFRIDKPLSPIRTTTPVAPAFERFTRVETFGSPYHHWIHVTVDPDDPDVFTFRPRLVATNLAPGK